jgi:hypothetical protein
MRQHLKKIRLITWDPSLRRPINSTILEAMLLLLLLQARRLGRRIQRGGVRRRRYWSRLPAWGRSGRPSAPVPLYHFHHAHNHGEYNPKHWQNN